MPLSIAHVTPYAWEVPHEVNVLVDRVAAELRGRGHRVVVVAPSRDGRLVRESRARIRRGGEDVLGAEVLAVGEVLPELPTASRRRAPGLPVDVARTVEELFDNAAFDVVHVHEPFALSTAAAALRHSRALNVGTFHAPAERLVSMQAARRIVELLFGRLDARVASYGSTAELIRRSFPADYRVVLPGTDPVERPERDGPVRIVFADEEERGAIRVFLRALRLLDPGLDWEAVVQTSRGAVPSLRVPERLRARVRFEDPGGLGGADVVVAASNGNGPAPGLLLRAAAAGAVPLASSLAVYEEVLADGDRGLLFPCGEPGALAAQLARLVGDEGLRERLISAAQQVVRGWDEVAGDYEAIYEEVAARRRDTGGNPEIARRLRGRPRIDVDLHMHTDHSGDCATPVEVLLETARKQGLGAIAVTDHNEVSGAFEAVEKAERFGVKVIVGEEVKT
ncbi:MAG TPA: glycosyltransferase, partial [Solirubrobacteraceae bacterium]